MQVGLDILETLVRSSPVPLSASLMNEAFPAAVQCMLNTDDNSTLQVTDSLHCNDFYEPVQKSFATAGKDFTFRN